MFKKARIELTAFYLLIIIVIISAFSILLFRYTAQHLRDNLEEDSSQQASAEMVISELGNAILVADAIIITASGFLSYWLAGRTLRPIGIALLAQERFSANASHELRTPLSVIKMDLEVFLKKSNPTIADAKILASQNLEEVDHMNGMVENLLMLARNKQTDVPMEFEEVSITKTINTVIKKMEPRAAAKHLSLVFKKDADVLVLGNERMLEQLFSNLIQNAISYTHAGSIVITVASSKTAMITITDTGIGIAHEDIDRIFEAFYKSDPSRMAKSGGVGLGLAIVKEIVSQHKGSIRVESEINRGTTVTVLLPLYGGFAS